VSAAATPDTVYLISRKRAAIYIVLCLAWFAAAWALMTYADFSKSVAMGFLNLVLVPFLIFANVMVLIKPTRLTLTDEGFDLRHWTAHEHVAWRAIDPLEVRGDGVSGMVVYSFTSGELPPGMSLVHHINHFFGAIDGSLPGGLPIKAPALCAEMNARRERALSA
jgi:hypothetical protein